MFNSGGARISMVAWKPPPPNYLKINCDGAYDGSNGRAAVSSICSKTLFAGMEGVEIITGRARGVNATNSLTAEAMAMKDGIQLAIALNATGTILEGDNADVISALVDSPSSSPWEMKGLIDDIKELASSITGISFNLVRRTANKVADWAARIARKDGLASSWMALPPLQLEVLLDEDRRWADPP